MFAHRAPPGKNLLLVAFGLVAGACADSSGGTRQVGVGLGRDATGERPTGEVTDAARAADADVPGETDRRADTGPAADGTTIPADATGPDPGAPEVGPLADDAGQDRPADGEVADAGAPDAARPAPDAAPPPPEPDAAPPAVCGNGVVEPGETCDDGLSLEGCGDRHDGGDGVCRPFGACADGFELAPDGSCRAFEPARGVDIFVDNFCAMEVRPPEVHVPPGARLQITWYNRSVDYPVDVWLSYGGGFLDLEPGTSWADRFEFCGGGARPFQAYADISTACSEHRFLIWCD